MIHNSNWKEIKETSKIKFAEDGGIDMMQQKCANSREKH